MRSPGDCTPLHQVRDDGQGVAENAGFAQVAIMLSMDFIKRHRVDVERAVRDKGVAVDLDALLRSFLSQPS